MPVRAVSPFRIAGVSSASVGRWAIGFESGRQPERPCAIYPRTRLEKAGPRRGTTEASDQGKRPRVWAKRRPRPALRDLTRHATSNHHHLTPLLQVAASPPR